MTEVKKDNATTMDESERNRDFFQDNNKRTLGHTQQHT